MSIIIFSNQVIENSLFLRDDCFIIILNNAEFGCQAKVKADTQNKTINITVQGESLSKQRYFSAIR